ncbi:SufE family protein [Crateriforma conspicua]|uniref:Cysteine desulfuration protein SufE n=1 Tax=Crateriforma conspicua TaxID=2527996 RepID=A0A5C6G2Q8_9PLAN|nr:SufE family protein [Crateriforma conspicua]TWU67680.1 Cysteine desulfuration protein SufE [Crateriforma conspicua]
MIDEIVQDIEDCDDPREQFELLIELGDQAESLDDKWKIENFRVQGCTSNVWLVALPDDSSPSGLKFLADSDAHLVRGLVTLVLYLVKDKTADEIAAYDFESKFEQLGLARHLSSARSNGLKSMADRVRQLSQMPAE